MTAVSVIVPARNAAGSLGDTLAALAAQDIDESYEVIVVDDGSEDGTASIAERAAGPVTVLRAGGVGPGPARNVGVVAAAGESLAFTDADCVPAPDWLREGLAALAGADLVQGAVRPDPGAVRHPFDRTVAVGHEGGLYEAANLFVSRELFVRLGGFEDWLGARLGKPLGEDIWLGWQARRAGARTAFCERALVHHAVFPRSAVEYVAERARLVYFPAIAAKVPELREVFFHRRWFLTRRSAAFDAAAAGAIAAALAARRLRGARRLAAALPLLAALPYARTAAGAALPWGRRAPLVLATEIGADAVGLGALAVGSVRRRTLLL